MHTSLFIVHNEYNNSLVIVSTTFRLIAAIVLGPDDISELLLSWFRLYINTTTKYQNAMTLTRLLSFLLLVRVPSVEL